MKQKIKDFFKKKENSEERQLVKVEEKRKINKEKIKEVALVLSAVVLIGVGYVNFSGSNQLKANNNTVQTYAKSTNNIGDVQLVSGESVLVENEEKNEIESVVQNTEIETEKSNNQEVESTSTNDTKSSSTNSYFTELKLNRDTIYSQSLDTYQKIIDSASISNEQKSIAVQEIEKINNMQNSILVAEELIRLKGFENVVIYVNRRFCKCSSKDSCIIFRTSSANSKYSFKGIKCISR